MLEYLNLIEEVLSKGEPRHNRTGIDTISLFGAQTKYDLRKGFPLVTTKKIVFDSVVRELIWFLKGSTNINDDLTQHTKIWDAWADEDGDLGPVYGSQWRNWGGSGIDQIQNVLDTIKNNPDSRRIIVSAWNVSDIPKMKLPPCHALFQFNVVNGFLDCQLYQRSADLALGVPFNIASYALLMEMIAQECNLVPRNFIHSLGDAHIYVNHIEGLRKQLTRTPKDLPTVEIANKPFFDIKFEDIKLLNYQYDPFIKFEVAV